MRELLAAAVSVVAPVSVALVVLAQGLGISPRQVVAYFKERPGLMLGSLAAQLLLVPAAALALILVLKPVAGVAVGLAILVSCPPAPLMIMSAPGRGGASAAFMAGLRLSMATLAFVTVPAVLYVLSIPLGFHADVELGPLVWVMARSILLPIGLGVALRGLTPAFAERIRPVLGKAGMIGVIAVLPVVLLAFYPALVNMDRWSYVVISAVSVAGLTVGHLFGPSSPAEKTALAIECGVRHPTLALVIGTANFGADRALSVPRLPLTARRDARCEARHARRRQDVYWPNNARRESQDRSRRHPENWSSAHHQIDRQEEKDTNMRHAAKRRFVAALLGAAIVVPTALAAQTMPMKEKEQLVSVAARVEAINQTTREVTLKGPQGNVVTFTVDKRVTRLNEVKVGDEVVADYYVSLAAEFRTPTAEEKANPLVVLTETAKAPADTQPAGGVLRITRAVVTVEGLDRPTKSLTVKGPGGNFATVKVSDVAALSKLRLGDTIVVTYTEALGVSLQKRAPVK